MMETLLSEIDVELISFILVFKVLWLLCYFAVSHHIIYIIGVSVWMWNYYIHYSFFHVFQITSFFSSIFYRLIMYVNCPFRYFQII